MTLLPGAKALSATKDQRPPPTTQRMRIGYFAEGLEVVPGAMKTSPGRRHSDGKMRIRGLGRKIAMPSKERATAGGIIGGN
jgi:hypothetical protein